MDNPPLVIVGAFLLLFLGTYAPLMALARRLGYPWISIALFVIFPGAWPVGLWILPLGRWPKAYRGGAHYAYPMVDGVEIEARPMTLRRYEETR